ncbi:hypothetical protein [Aureliella helgolandensis]|uniref:DUF3806 domain-containing protein n=1 Tax=Aureliella helgolandensis TaxID=2527968 RepID=A0A518G8Z9_9BACT|nr:hypothetical protein [Aureliella helgolandensis]QDV25061.1 hypothetical protein Q31a_33830 [Aureliella helgolandensis]
MRITEEPIESDLMRDIESCAMDALPWLEIVATEPLTASAVVAAIDRFVYQWQQGQRPDNAGDEDFALILGSLWGMQLVESLGWDWSGVIFQDFDDARAVGVFSPKRSLAIYPFHFLHSCMEGDAPVTIELAFNLLVEGSRIPKLPDQGFENVMDNVHHIGS